MKKLFTLLLFIAFSKCLLAQIDSNDLRKSLYISISGYRTPLETIQFSPVNFTHQASLTASPSNGFQVKIGRSHKYKNSEKLDWDAGILYGFFPHAIHLIIPPSENSIGWDINDVLSDLDTEYFGGFFGITYINRLPHKFSLKTNLNINFIKQIKLGFNLESLDAIDDIQHVHKLYDAEIQTPPNRDISLLPELQIGIERHFSKKFAWQFSLFQNYGTRLSHLAHFTIYTKQGVLEGQYKKQFYYGGIQMGLIYNR